MHQVLVGCRDTRRPLTYHIFFMINGSMLVLTNPQKVIIQSCYSFPLEHLSAQRFAFSDNVLMLCFWLIPLSAQ